MMPLESSEVAHIREAAERGETTVTTDPRAVIATYDALWQEIDQLRGELYRLKHPNRRPGRPALVALPPPATEDAP